jgi:mycothiol S-conjugate amidase
VAFDAAGDPAHHPELGEPWQPSKLYYNSGWTRARMLALHEGMLAAGLESPYTEWLEKSEERPDRGDKITTRVECGEYFEVRDEALRAHATQVDPDGFWFRIPLELQQKVWPTEDFELARSLVDSPVPESDLFAGIREPVDAH